MEEPSQRAAMALIRMKWPIFVAAALTLLLIIGGFLFWKAKHPASLLPAAIVSQASGFTPYFYVSKIPANYVLDIKHVGLDGGVMLLPLSNPNGPTVVLSEQAMPQRLSGEQLFQNGQKVENVMGSATINSVEGRLVGAMISQDHKTLILINAPGDTDSGDITALLQGLQPVH